MTEVRVGRGSGPAVTKLVVDMWSFLDFTVISVNPVWRMSCGSSRNTFKCTMATALIPEEDVVDNEGMNQSDVCEDDHMEADFQLWEKKRKRNRWHSQREADSSGDDQGDRDNKVRNKTRACESASECGSGAQQAPCGPARSGDGQQAREPPAKRESGQARSPASPTKRVSLLFPTLA
ncbi:hypothetical protein E2C01_058242 [Portunus trituberculatus]|uniref:Uncharacterized protein n=1 Tax=Portunus trituberculatus TaxID=210409 RepID=A0A5B7GVW3_PORTR|nr:hypothetical protein [Portunus trituberculatus]